MHSIIPFTFKKYLQKSTFLSQHRHAEICNFIEENKVFGMIAIKLMTGWLPVLKVGE